MIAISCDHMAKSHNILRPLVKSLKSITLQKVKEYLSAFIAELESSPSPTGLKKLLPGDKLRVMSSIVAI